MQAPIAAVVALAAATLISFTTASCSQDRGMSQPGGTTPRFETSEAAVAQGRRDLLEVLRVSPDLELGMDPAQVERATSAPPLTVVEIDFRKLLQADGITDLQQLAVGERGTATPLVADEQVIALIETSRDAGGWRVAAIGNQPLKEDLNAVRSLGFGAGEIRYFEVPNLEARIFAVQVEGQTRYLTRHRGFSLRQPVDLETLLPRLRADAAEFERLYGDKLKGQKLVR